MGLADNSTALGAGSGTIAYLTFTIPAAAPSGSNAVTIAGADGGLNEGGLALTTVNGSVNVETPTVGPESVFYNASPKFDVKSNSSAASSADFNAIAIDKTPLLPGGTGTFANYTSYSLGLNGILVDFVDLAPGATFTAGDFTFMVGNTGTSWTAAPAPLSVTPITGTNGDTYADIIWANNAIADEWLEVTVLSTGDTGDQIGGSDLWVQIGDGGAHNGGTTTGPTILSLNMTTGTIFSTDNTGENFTPSLDLDTNGLFAFDQVNTNGMTSVLDTGVLATVTVDTVGFGPGTTFNVSFGSVAETAVGPGNNTDFFNPGGTVYFPATEPGVGSDPAATITLVGAGVPEPTSIGLLAVAAAGLVRRGRRANI